MAIPLDSVLPTHEHTAFEQSLLSLGKRSIRLHPKRQSRSLPFETTCVPWYRLGAFLEDSNIRPSTFLNYSVGDYYIQDAASLLPLALIDWEADNLAGKWVCDLCAAPGGKASAIAERLGPAGFLVANETVQSRVDVLKYSLARTGTPNYVVTRLDPETLAERLPSFFDIVLVDAPCSGQTLVGRDKRDENAFSDKQIVHCALRQHRILSNALELLKPGGQLIYSTCTFAIEENEAQIQSLLDRFPASLQPIERPELSRWHSARTPGCYRLWPHRDSCAGGFAAGLHKLDALESKHSSPTTASSTRARLSPQKPTKKNASHKDQQQQRLHEKTAIGVLQEIGKLNNLQLSFDGSSLVARTEVDAEKMETLRSVSVESAPLLVLSGMHFVPTQCLAMLDLQFFQPHQALDLQESEARSVLQGQSLPRSTVATEPIRQNCSGWTLARWEESGLGWLKGIEKRYNNHLPPWARS